MAASTCSAEILDDLVTLAAAIDLYHNMDMTFWLRKRKQRWSKCHKDTVIPDLCGVFSIMVRYVPTVCLSLLLLWGGTACTLKRGESAAVSERGYRFSLQVSDTIIFFGLPDPRYPQTAEAVVRVRDAQGQPIDGMTVLFSVTPSWTQYASLTPAEVRTRNGEARAVFAAKTTGVVPVTARVDNVTLEAAITVERRPVPSDAGE